MANLTDFLTNIADTIRDKKGTTNKILAENFSTEIENIETGVDTSDATATVSDIINPKTAYLADGNKYTGTIQSMYESDDITSHTLAYSIKNNNCCGISPDGQYIITISGTNVLIYKIMDDAIVTLVNTTALSDIGITSTSFFQICVSYTYISEKKCYVAFRTSGTTQTVFITIIDLTNYEWSMLYSLPSFTANYSGGCMCFAKYTTNIIACGGRKNNSTTVKIYELFDDEYVVKTTISTSNQDRTPDLEFQGHDHFLVFNHIYHWDNHTSSYAILSNTFDKKSVINTGEVNYIFYNNSYKVILLQSNNSYIQYGNYTDNGTSISLDSLTTLNIDMSNSVGYINADDDCLYVYNGTYITAYSLQNNSFDQLNKVPATGTFDIGQSYRIAFNNTMDMMLCPISTSVVNGISIDKSGRKLVSLVRDGEEFRITSDATATADDIVLGKTAYANGEKLIGTYTYKPEFISFAYYSGTDLTNALTGLDTSNITTMYQMFANCINLTKLDLSGFNTSNVIYMSEMFYGCYDLTNINLSKFDTSSVTDMTNMFHQNTCLVELDLSSFDTSSVTSMNSMFAFCNSLTSLDISSFDTSSVTDMSSMFYNCKNLENLDLSNFNTSQVTNMSSMFSRLQKLNKIRFIFI